MDNNVTYISPAGLEALKVEVVRRIKILRPEIAQKISDAKEMGDLSENFAYHEAKEQQGQNEMRILSIQEMLVNAVVVEEKLGGSINLGSSFTVKIGGIEKHYELVGESEADPLSGKISNASPLGSAFIGKKPGDKVEVEVPSGIMTYEVVEVK